MELLTGLSPENLREVLWLQANCCRGFRKTERSIQATIEKSLHTFYNFVTTLKGEMSTHLGIATPTGRPGAP
jgi:hypothetical protein